MDAVSNSFRSGTYPHRNVGRWGKRWSFYVLRFLAVAGVLAFIFSVISPDDDSTQPDFATACNVSHLSKSSFNGARCSSSCGKRVWANSLSFSLEVPATFLGGDPGFSLHQLPMVSLSLHSERGPPFC